MALTRSVLSELKSAVENAELVNIGLSFVNHKYDLTTYAIYCTKLPKAKLLYDSIMAGDDMELLDEIVVSGYMDHNLKLRNESCVLGSADISSSKLILTLC